MRNDYYWRCAGILTSELLVFIPMLEAAGVTSFHVTLANHSSLSDTIPMQSHPYFSQKGCFMKFCDIIRGLSKLPICGVGSLGNPDYIEEQLQVERINCAAMSRQLIADSAWVLKVYEDKANEIKRYVR